MSYTQHEQAKADMFQTSPFMKRKTVQAAHLNVYNKVKNQHKIRKNHHPMEKNNPLVIALFFISKKSATRNLHSTTRRIAA